MNDTIDTTQNTEQQPTTPTQEASGDQGEKLFTQADLDRIIGERLARAKKDRANDDREAALKARENRMDCLEFITHEGYPKELLELFDTTDTEKFKAAVEKLDGLGYLPSSHRKPVPRIVAGSCIGGGHGAPSTAALLAAAFKPPQL